MKAGSINLQKLFESTIRYRVPLFQRPYVWDRERNWEPLWEAIRILAEGHLLKGKASPYFLGAVVLDQMAGQTGSIESRQVIDGQQRLTTIQIMLAALRDLAVYYELPKYASRFAKLTVNDEALRDAPDDEFKVWPTNCDRDVFRKTMKAGSKENLYTVFGVPYDEWTCCQIADAYLYFWDVLLDWMEEDNPVEPGEDLSVPELEARFEALWNTIRTQLQLVAIDLEADDDAQVIFETLNNYGTQLLPADLVKNYLLREAESNGADAEDLNTRFWIGFESDFWRKKVRQGRITRPRIDLFLQNFLTLKTLNDVPVTHVFTHFKSYVEDTVLDGTADEHAEGLAAFHLQQLQIYSRIFRKFVTAKPESKNGIFFGRLAIVDTATVYPLLLEAFHDLKEPASRVELRRLLKDIESFLVRRMFCGLTTKNYNKLFLEMVRVCKRGGKFSASAGREFLLKQEGDSSRWPNNKEFRDAILTRPLYKLGKGKLRMILLAIERQLEDGKTEPVIYTDVKGFTIEHVMPQAWQKYWPLPKPKNEQDDKESLTVRREKLIHTIGNLTLLTKKLNPSLSARSWDYKKKQIIAKSKMNLNRDRFFKVADWNEECIEKRSKELYKLAAGIWRYPGTSPPTLPVTPLN